MADDWRQRLHDLLSGVVSVGYKLKTQYGFEPLPGSQGDQELRVGITAGDYKPVREAHSLAETRLVAASDDLATLADLLLERPNSVFAISTLARTTLEMSARATWLLDGRIDARTRGLRALAEILYAFQEETKFPIEEHDEDVGDNGVPGFKDYVAARLEAFARAAESGGFEVTRKATTGRPEKLKELTRPGATEVIRVVAGVRGELVYRDLSGISHGNPTSLVRQTEVVPEDERPADHQYRIAAQVSLTRPTVTLASDAPRLAVVFRTYLRVLVRKSAWYGWDARGLKEWTYKALGEMQRLVAEAAVAGATPRSTKGC